MQRWEALAACRVQKVKTPYRMLETPLAPPTPQKTSRLITLNTHHLTILYPSHHQLTHKALICAEGEAILACSVCNALLSLKKNIIKKSVLGENSFHSVQNEYNTFLGRSHNFNINLIKYS